MADGQRPTTRADEILRTYLYRDHAVAYCCAYAGLKLTDARPVTGRPDRWVELPPHDYWSPDG